MIQLCSWLFKSTLGVCFPLGSAIPSVLEYIVPSLCINHKAYWSQGATVKRYLNEYISLKKKKWLPGIIALSSGPVSCTVVSVWLICNKTWHFKSPACGTSDNKLSLCCTLTVRVCGLSSFTRQQFFVISPLDILLIWQNEAFLRLCPLFELCVPPCPPVSLQVAYLHLVICRDIAVVPVWRLETSCDLLSALCEMGHDLFFSLFQTPSILRCSARPSVLHCCLSPWCGRIIHAHRLKAECGQSLAKTHYSELDSRHSSSWL